MSGYDKISQPEQVRKVRRDILTDIGGDNPFLDKAKAQRYEQARMLTARLALLYHERYSNLSSDDNERKDFGDKVSAIIRKFVQTGEMPNISQLDQAQGEVAGRIATILKPYALKASYPTEAPQGVKTNYQGILRQHGLDEYASDENAVKARQFAEYLLFKSAEQLAQEQLALAAPSPVSTV